MECRTWIWLCTLPIAVAMGSGSAFAQPARGFEAGAAIGTIDLRGSSGEKPFAVALRAGYRFAPAFGVEAEWLECPVDPSGYYGQTLLVAGAKAGVTYRSVAALVKVRGGVLRLDGPHPRAYNDGKARTEPALDVGLVLEGYVSRRVAIRIDASRTIVAFGSDPIRGPLPPHSKVLGTTSNALGLLGVQYRW